MYLGFIISHLSYLPLKGSFQLNYTQFPHRLAKTNRGWIATCVCWVASRERAHAFRLLCTHARSLRHLDAMMQEMLRSNDRTHNRGNTTIVCSLKFKHHQTIKWLRWVQCNLFTRTTIFSLKLLLLFILRNVIPILSLSSCFYLSI